MRTLEALNKKFVWERKLIMGNNNPNIKIYVVCHKPSFVPENPYLYPIQVGTAINSKVGIERTPYSTARS